jgi:hypothetical protein
MTATEAYGKATLTDSAISDMSVLAHLQDLHCNLIEARAELGNTAQRVKGYPEQAQGGNETPPSSVHEYLMQIRTVAQDIRELSARLSNNIGG